MIAHLSLPARDPLRVARVIAKVIDGEVLNFPPVKGAVMALARDGSGLAIEVWPETATQHPGTGEPIPGVEGHGAMLQPWDFQMRYDSPAPRANAVHIALTTKMPVEELLALGKAEGWRCIATDRGGAFKLVELWLENSFMLEILQESELPRYQSFTQPEIVRQIFGAPA